MNRNRKAIRITVLIFAVIITAVVIIYFVSQAPQYERDDPLHGSYLVENEEQAEIIHPANFVISLTGNGAPSELQQEAQKNSVDFSEPWLYCAKENRIFQAEKEGEKLFIYENDEKIGTLTYSCKRFLWIQYDESYVMNWRGTNLDLVKIMQVPTFVG